MDFSDTTNNSGIIQSCESLVFGPERYGDISGNPTRLQTFTRFINESLDEIAQNIIEVDATWQWDDTNHTDYPIATTTLVANQQDYTLSVSHLNVIAVSVKDSSGNYRVLHPIDEMELNQENIDPSEFYETAGLPTYYDLKSNSIFLYPAPAASQVTTAQGLKISFQREPSYFLTSDTTKEPGIARIFHYLVPLIASVKYLEANEQFDKAAVLQSKASIGVARLRSFYSKRHPRSRPRLRATFHSAR